MCILQIYIYIYMCFVYKHSIGVLCCGASRAFGLKIVWAFWTLYYSVRPHGPRVDPFYPSPPHTCCLLPDVCCPLLRAPHCKSLSISYIYIYIVRYI